MTTDYARKMRALTVFLRVYGILSLVVFIPLFVGFIVQTPLLSEHGGALNWLIWNDVMSGQEHAHVPPMLFAIYIAWDVFLLLAARRPAAFESFLSFTMWANLVHGLLMLGQAAMDMESYWSKFLTDIPFILFLTLGIFIWRPNRTAPAADRPAPKAS